MTEERIAVLSGYILAAVLITLIVFYRKMALSAIKQSSGNPRADRVLPKNIRRIK